MLCFLIYIICETFHIKWRKHGAVPTNTPARIGSSPVLHRSRFPAVPALRGSRSCVWYPALGFSATSVAADRHAGRRKGSPSRPLRPCPSCCRTSASQRSSASGAGAKLCPQPARAAPAENWAHLGCFWQNKAKITLPRCWDAKGVRGARRALRAGVPQGRDVSRAGSANAEMHVKHQPASHLPPSPL